MGVSNSDFVAYLEVLEQVRYTSHPVRLHLFGGNGEKFARRRWLRGPREYLTHQMVPFLDCEIEVEVEIDEDASVYRYRSPQCRSRILTRPLAEIALYDFSVDVWLDDLARMIGLEPRYFSRQRERVPHHLWHLGDHRVGDAPEFAPIFVARQWQAAPRQEMSAVLSDPAWVRHGVVLLHRRPESVLPDHHEARALSEFVRIEDGDDHFDAAAFSRVLRGFVKPAGVDEQEQYLRGNLLKLPHFTDPKPLSDERAKVIKAMWGQDGVAPPIKSWAEANQAANTGYSSFNDAFDWDGCTWRDIFDRVSHGKYHLRRNP
jgi:hypothetical protein